MVGVSLSLLAKLYIFRVVSRAYLRVCYYDILSYSSIFVNNTVPAEM